MGSSDGGVHVDDHCDTPIDGARTRGKDRAGNKNDSLTYNVCNQIGHLIHSHHNSLPLSIPPSAGEARFSRIRALPDLKLPISCPRSPAAARVVAFPHKETSFDQDLNCAGF